MLSPQQLTVLTTSQCTARCAHCSMRSSPSRRERLDAKTINRVIDELYEQYPLRVVIFAGGEPTLLGEALLDAIAHADYLGLTTRLVTNAAWAITEAKASHKIAELRDAGLAELNISADDYHLPDIPFENVVTAWRAAKRRGFRSVVIANCYGPRSTVTPEFIEKAIGETLPMRFDCAGESLPLPEPEGDGTIYMLSNSYLQLLGRGHGNVDTSSLFPVVSEQSLAGGCPWAATSPALSPRGKLVACCGMEAEGTEVLDYGDTAEHSATTLIDRADGSVIVNAIALLGPLFLQKFLKARAPSLYFRRRYFSVCEICEDIVGRPEAVAALQDNLGALTSAVAAARTARHVGAQ